ncbi:hypothetical protein WM40_03375 [Robbsia andropogonis]|uniref:Uncharacterized protein n=1 Tax=Robbsia andropogonis TaxID=28092 RepID=A0A0F5K625_9BURK|nr:hypothetical protein [Robbsia andropogonis]KKB64997.1 hypothetical protein WM40_03375 [Robbsia andropogonis]MCP1118562.1 hypothetical protein [Robbsia andropogonis]MCP1128029.1 hypothetical protein [Robbsia andropogonis]
MSSKYDDHYLDECDLICIFEVIDCAYLVNWDSCDNYAECQCECKLDPMNASEKTQVLSLSEALSRLRVIEEICHERLSPNERKVLSDICNTIQFAEMEERWRELHYCHTP